MIISKRKKKFLKKRYFPLGKVIALFVAGISIISAFWYNVQLTPISRGSEQLVKVTIEYGQSPSEIGVLLKKASVIRSPLAFNIYTRLSGKRNNLQAGTYRLSPAKSTRQIVDDLVLGSVEEFDITFYPGATLVDITDKPFSEKDDITTVLKKAGYTQAEIDYALDYDYESQLFAGKPDGTSLEGYIYGETYKFNSGVPVTEIFKRVFDEFYAEVQKDNLVQAFAAHGLNLYQGITMASIIQREVSNPEDQRKVAQVFYRRLAEGLKLESDVTYQYIADKTGVKRDVNIDSPYNTRRYEGLPPGPISVPGRTALLAVANPADTTFLYFLSGDDDVTYFSYTNDEHVNNRAAYCIIKCSKP